ncbi:MAG: hypothetical protein IIA05_11450 [Proteobacteria bacterium]|nr:hypothetical protein [Pseudomonadota bacterium]
MRKIPIIESGALATKLLAVEQFEAPFTVRGDQTIVLQYVQILTENIRVGLHQLGWSQERFLLGFFWATARSSQFSA